VVPPGFHLPGQGGATDFEDWVVVSKASNVGERVDPEHRAGVAAAPAPWHEPCGKD
jgi:hypothetical protein